MSNKLQPCTNTDECAIWHTNPEGPWCPNCWARIPLDQRTQWWKHRGNAPDLAAAMNASIARNRRIRNLHIGPRTETATR